MRNKQALWLLLYLLCACSAQDLLEAAARRPRSDASSTASRDAAATQCCRDDDAAAGDAGANHTVADSNQAGAALDAQLAWVLDALQREPPPSEAEIVQHFSPEFLAQLPPDAVAQSFVDLRMLRPLRTKRVLPTGAAAAQIELATSAGPQLLKLQLEPAEPHRISVLLLHKIPTSVDEAEAQLRALASDVELYSAEIIDGACAPLEARSGAQALAIGSTIKLWILLALDKKLTRESDTKWSTPLVVRDELKSLPTGKLQDEPAGATLPLRDFARNMISISDNTAADHLIDFIGRETVERELFATAHSMPHANIPLLYTREFFALKLWATPDERAAIRDAELQDKRRLLDALRREPIDLGSASDWTMPRHLEFEWFARGADVCAVQAALAGRSHGDPSAEPLATLALNPGVLFAPGAWSYIGYKGGAEPGVLSFSWLLRRADGRWFSVVLTLNDSTRAIDSNPVIAAAYGLAQLTASTP